MEHLTKDYAILIGIIGFIVGGLSTIGLSGFFFDKVWGNLWKNIENRKLKKKLDKEAIDCSQQNEVFPLAHGSPVWRNNDIHISDTGRWFIVEIPNEKRNQFLLLDNNFKFRKARRFDINQEHLAEMNLPDLESRIARHSEIVADDLIKKKEKGRLVFNGEMFGIWNIIRENTEYLNDVEYRVLKMETYNTDFFTFRVMASIYQELRQENHEICKVTKLEEVLIYKSFLSSFGLGTFVLLYGRSHVVLAKRSLYTTHSQNNWHYTMNEAFSQTDIEDDLHIPSLFKCHFRGLYEELNIHPKDAKDKTFFLDLYFCRDVFEMGITSFIELDAYAFKDLQFFHSCAKDGEVEIDELKCIPVTKKSVSKFLKTEEMTKSSNFGFRMLMARLLNGVLPHSRSYHFEE